MRFPSPPPLLSPPALGAPAFAQTTYIAPFPCQSNEGGTGNTIPWWAGSATYQQIHNANDLAWVFPNAVALIRGLSFRTDSTYALTARTLDAQITLGATPVLAAAASATFANNLGPTPAVALAYTSINLPAAPPLATPNPQAWFFPFSAPWVYILANGNLCWELRIKNSSSSATSYTDAASAAPAGASFMPLLGIGCVATGQSQAATIGGRSLTLPTGVFTQRLEYGAASAPAAMVLGAVPQSLTLPGLCSALQTLPLLSISGTTDAAGTWNLSLTLGNLTPLPRATVYAQFAFADPGLTHGFGLSSCSPVTLPGPTSTFGLVRIYAVPSSSGQGNELAQTGSVGGNYGLVTGFDT